MGIAGMIWYGAIVTALFGGIVIGVSVREISEYLQRREEARLALLRAAQPPLAVYPRHKIEFYKEES